MTTIQKLGELDGDVRLRVRLESDGMELGELALGSRKDGGEYSPQDRALLEQVMRPLARGTALARVDNRGRN
jgi:hypothetical protein